MINRLLTLSLSLAFAASLPVQAQRLSATSVVRTGGQVPLQEVNGSELPPVSTGYAPVRPQAKGAGAAIYTQTFAALPAGWSVTANAGSVNGWRWANAAPTGTGNSFPINGLIHSTTKGDGWLLYNADSVLSKVGTVRPFGGAITSSPIPVGPTHMNVMLSFQQYYRFSTGDSCFVDVSNNGTVWTSYPIHPNGELTQYGFLYRNPTTTTLNISAVAGGQPNVFVRFRFNSTAAQYSFNWLIDDLVIYDADAVDLGITYSGIASGSDTNASFSNSYSYTSIPLRFADSVYPITYLSNYGLSATGNTVLTANYYRGGTLLSTQTASVPTSPLGARDSAVVFNTGYKPTVAGDYVVALSVAASGDGAMQNNVDTIRFSVTDTMYAPHGREFTERNSYLYRPSNSTLQYWGARFTIANGQRDTMTSVSAGFRPVTVAGQQVQAQLYQATGSGATYDWILLGISATRTLTAADISTGSNVVMTNFPMRLINRNYTPFVLGNGDYAIVLTTVNATSDVALYSMVPPLPTAPAFIGYQGQSDVSGNDGSPNFAVNGGIATGLAEVPLVQPNFGNARALLAVSETQPVVLGTAFPNPANTEINIPVALQQSGTAQLTLSNTLGQIVAKQDLGQMNAGTMKLASVATGHLPEGVYFYAIAAENGRATGRVVVKH